MRERPKEGEKIRQLILPMCLYVRLGIFLLLDAADWSLPSPDTRALLGSRTPLNIVKRASRDLDGGPTTR